MEKKKFLQSSRVHFRR
uniref:Uncharacterized protein n=1 Tax=Anguilla anguilla TaxID=7936 RepID=A0A0E9TLP4_ANGAN